MQAFAQSHNSEKFDENCMLLSRGMVREINPPGSDTRRCLETPLCPVHADVYKCSLQVEEKIDPETPTKKDRQQIAERGGANAKTQPHAIEAQGAMQRLHQYSGYIGSIRFIPVCFELLRCCVLLSLCKMWPRE